MDEKQLAEYQASWLEHPYSQVVWNDLQKMRSDAVKAILLMARSSTDVGIYAKAKQIEACDMLLKFYQKKEEGGQDE